MSSRTADFQTIDIDYAEDVQKHAIIEHEGDAYTVLDWPVTVGDKIELRVDCLTSTEGEDYITVVPEQRFDILSYS